MQRRQLLKAMGLSAAAVILPGCANVFNNSVSTKKPNIILIMADDLGYGDLSCYGNKHFSTPNIDALADAGIRFTDFHSNGPVCSPTRAALLTGRYQQRCGIDRVVTAANHRHTGMALEETTIAEILRSAGYKTALFGKWHLGYDVKFNPARQGFDEFIGYVSGNVDYHSHVDQTGYEDWWKNEKLTPEKGYTTDLVTEHGIRFIEANKNRPFFLYLPHEAPHYPYQGRGDKADRTIGGKFPVPGSRKDIPGAYKEMVQAMDEGVGRIVQTVKQLGIEQDTFIFFCSDNGANKRGSNAPLNGHKGTLWEGGHRVPAIAVWSGKIEPATETDQTAMTMDLFATIASIAELSLPGGLKLDGLDLKNVLTANIKLPERTLFWRYGKQKAVRKGDWKLLIQREDVRLYNLTNDLAEQNNVASQYPNIEKSLQAELDIWENQVSLNVEQRT